MIRSIVAVLTLFVLMAAGCTSPGTPVARKPRMPFPGPVAFSGDFDRPPRAKVLPSTLYPPFLAERGESGSATVVFRVKSDGYVEEAKVESATHPAFGGSALSTVGRMVFAPATKAGKPVPVTARVTFPFGFE